jgi:hypothetical protein
MSDGSAEEPHAEAAQPDALEVAALGSAPFESDFGERIFSAPGSAMLLSKTIVLMTHSLP